jgi:hypothetical protein
MAGACAESAAVRTEDQPLLDVISATAAWMGVRLAA